MNRRQILKGIALTGAGGALGFDVFAFSCSTSPTQLARWTGQVISELTEARAIFVEANLSAIVEIVDKALEVAKLLKRAFENADNASVLTLLAQLLDPDGVIQSIALAVGLLQDENQRRVVATVLIVTRLALNLIAAHVMQAAIEQAGSEAAAMHEIAPRGTKAEHDAGLVMSRVSDGDGFLRGALNVAYGVKLP